MSKLLLHSFPFFAFIFISCYINNTTEYYYTVTVKSGSHGTVCNAGNYQCRYQDALNVQVCSVDDGYTFKEWKLDSMSSSSNCVISDRFNVTATITQIRGRVVVYPEFVQSAYTLNIVSDTLGKVTAQQIKNIVPGVGTKITARALPKDTIEFRFSHWTITNGNGEISGDSIVMESDCSIKPVFERNNYLLTVTESSNGRILDSIGGLMSGTYSFPFGYVVRLNASADTGYQYSSWAGATGNASTTITMDGSKTIGASFIQIPGKSGVIYVWSGLTTGNNTGANWANAYSDLNTAVSAAAADAVIWVKCGVYSPTSTLALVAHVKIYGGFNGFESASQDVSNRSFYNNFSIISGSSAPVIMKLSNGRDTIDGFVFTSAVTNAIYIESSSNCIEDCVIKNTGSTSASNAVKLLPLYGSTMTDNVIQRTVFHSNKGTGLNAGKAINIASDVFGTKIINSVFYKNGGPAINNGNTTTDDALRTSIISCTIVDNGSTSLGAPGGIRNSSGRTFIQGSILWYNKSDGTKATQIDVADWVEDCDVQDHSTTGVTTKKRWQNDNLEVDPVLNSITILTDGAWFAPSSGHAFFTGSNNIAQC
ncbi:MAG TPA: hypothetical protein VHO70_07055 [Chitinispirillaceae bacterium]|nr:hypothetical protein [Chitinispirillaceae bacterium]